MRKVRTAQGVTFPYPFQTNGRIGKIYKLGNGTFKTYFTFGRTPNHKTHATFDAACLYLDAEFSVLDTNSSNALALNPLRGDVRGYSELERLLIDQGNGASLRDAVNFYLANAANRRFEPKSVGECSVAFLEAQRANSLLKNLAMSPGE